MKFIGGFISGVIATIFALFLMYGMSKTDNDTLKNGDTLPGLLMFPQKGECITKNDLEIFQTMKPNMALAKFGEFPNETLLLLVNYEGISYYDKQKIQVPAKKCARQIGTYKYETRMGLQSTVPVVIIE